MTDSLPKLRTRNRERPNFDKTNFCCDVSSFAYEDNIVIAVSCWSSISVLLRDFYFHQDFDQCQTVARKLSVSNLLRYKRLVGLSLLCSQRHLNVGLKLCEISAEKIFSLVIVLTVYKLHPVKYFHVSNETSVLKCRTLTIKSSSANAN